jgi:hypothetical protein
MSHDPAMHDGAGQSPDQVTEVGRMVPAALPSVDNSTEEHRRSGPIASRVTRWSARPEPSDQPVPDQPARHSQIASVGPLEAWWSK